MERTESIVVSVPPSHENAKIREMSVFGWSLQNRQEVVGHLREAETPGNLGAAVLRGAFEGATSTKTVEYDHYVKLHFARDLSMPNLARIQELEAEYRSLPLPQPASLKAPGCFTLFGVVGFVVCLATIGQQGTPGPSGVIMYLVWTVLGAFWLKSRLGKRAAAEAVVRDSVQRAESLRAEVTALL